MALRIATVADSISKLSVTGVTLKDLDQIPAEGDRVPIIIPNPENYVSGFSATRDSYGGASAKWTVTYTLNYRLLYQKVGTGRGIFDVFNNMTAKAFAFIDALLAIGVIAGCEDIVPQNVVKFGPVTDPSGVLYFGCDFEILVTEFVN